MPDTNYTGSNHHDTIMKFGQALNAGDPKEMITALVDHFKWKSEQPGVDDKSIVYLLDVADVLSSVELPEPIAQQKLQLKHAPIHNIPAVIEPTLDTGAEVRSVFEIAESHPDSH